MDLWNRISGVICLELTAADPEKILNRIAELNVEIWDIERDSQIQVRFQIQKNCLEQVDAIAEKMGASIREVRTDGLIYRLLAWKKRPAILLCLLILSILTLLLPERILFLDVVGNESIPTRLILESAAEHGLKFGADRRALRSEEIKNELLGELGELEWVGVNTYGCRAVITVRERGTEPDIEQGEYCSIVAAVDGVVESIVMKRGNLLCQPGQAVSQGDVLVSGYTDLGICTRAIAADAEIYAVTMRSVCGALPSALQIRGDEIREEVRISVIIGKKRINFYSDSGILPATCGKMTYSLPLKLPGGDTLPVTLVIQHILWYNTINIVRSQAQAEEVLSEASERSVLETAVAGQILTRQTELVQESECVYLYGKFQCREMIARRDSGVYLEGDTKDDSQNSQRGAG